MVCQACGAPLEAGGRFCSRCGAVVAMESAGPAAGASGASFAGSSGGSFGGAQAPHGYVPDPAAYPGVPAGYGKVGRHVQRLGILWCVFAAYRVLGGLAGLFFFSAMATHRFGNWPFPSGAPSMFPPGWMAFLLPFMAAAIALSAALAVATGVGLIYRKPWARVLAIIAGVLALFKFPFGTALGIYTLWVLAAGTSGAEYDSIADRA